MLKMKIAAVLMVSLMMAVSIIPLMSDDSDATDSGGMLYGMGWNQYQIFGTELNNVADPIQIASSLGSIDHVFASDCTLFFLTSDGKLYCLGYNGYGQLGNGTTTNVTTPTQIGASLGTITDVACSFQTTFFLTSDGKLYGMGNNTSGQIGNGDSGTNSKVTSPYRIGSSLGTITDVVCSTSATYFLTSDGKLYGMGYNGSGLIGDGTTTNVKVPKQIGASLGTITDVKTGGNHTFFLTSDGKLYGMGRNEFGQQGDGTTTSVLTPTQIGASLGTITDFVSSNTAFFLTSDGKLYGMGNNNQGQLGDGTTTNVTTPTQIGASLGTITDVVSCSTTTYFLTSDGKLYGMGRNYYGQMGDGTTTNVLTPTQIGASLGTITDVVCSGSTTFFLTSDGKLYGMGQNDYGQMGDGTTTSVLTPTQIGASLGTITDVVCSTVTTFFIAANNSMTVTIESNNEYGSVDISELEIDDPDEAIVVSGDTLTYGSTVVTASPVSDSVQYDYSFVGWYDGSTLIPNGEFAVTESMTITAVFSADLNQYTVSFVSSNPDYGSVSPSSLVVDYGTSIVLEGSDLTIGETTIVAAPAVSNAQYSYAFSHWTVPDSVGSVTGDITVTGTFTSSVNTYTVSFVSTDYSLGVMYPSVITGVPYGSVVTVEGDSVFIDDIEVTAIAMDENLRARMSVSTGYQIVDDIEVSVSFEEPSALDKFFESVSGSSELVVVGALAASILSMVFFIRRR